MNGVVDENVSIVFCLTLAFRPNTKTTINTKQRPKIEWVRTLCIHSQFNCDPINFNRSTSFWFCFSFCVKWIENYNWNYAANSNIIQGFYIHIMRWVVECGMSLGINYAFIASYSSHSSDLSSLFYSMKISKK